jgi:glycosyltransferase involved in cell wall biosynthesis
MTASMPPVGFITYDLQEFTVDCIHRIAARYPGRIKAYPVLSRTASDVPFQYRASSLDGSFFSVRTRAATPEGFLASLNFGAAMQCVRENEIVVLFGLQGPTALLAAILARCGRRKVISVNQTLPSLFERRRRWWVRSLKRILIRMCDLHVSQSRVTTEVMQDVYGVSPKLIKFAPFEAGGTLWRTRLDGIGESRGELRQRFGWLPADCVFIFVGAMLYLKGIEVLIAAAGKLSKRRARFKVVFIGPAAAQAAEHDLEDYRTLADEAGLTEIVDIVGAKEPNELAKYYKAADVLILPTQKETFSKVIVEAAMAGLPHITTSACGGVDSVVHHGRTGLVVEPGDADELSHAMSLLLDEKTRSTFGREAKRSAELWCDPDEEVRGYISALLAPGEGN